MNLTRAIIVDDEEDARDVLATLIKLSGFPIEIVKSCSNLQDAVKNIKELEPDVVFLDIQMPEYAGYEIVRFFDEIKFEIVFVTAFDKYALKAFELCAADYLVKPINRTRLNQTLERIVEKVDQRDSLTEYQILVKSLEAKENDKIVIPEVGYNRILNLIDINCIQGQGSYSIIHIIDGSTLTVSKNLKYFEKVLPEDANFFRSQKSWIINLDYVKQYNGNQGNIVLEKNVVAKISPNRMDDFIAKIKL